MFFEDQTSEDINKTEKIDSQNNKSLVDDYLIPTTNRSIALEETQDYNVYDDQEDVEPIHGLINDVVIDQQPTPAQAITSNIFETSYRSSSREKKKSTRYSAYQNILLKDMGEPIDCDKTIQNTHRDEWVESMEDEMKSIHENGTTSY